MIKNHPLDFFGKKASEEDVLGVLERFFELKVDTDDGLPSHICRACHQKVRKFKEFSKVIVFSRHQQESVLRVKRGRRLADSPSTNSPYSRRK